VQHCPKCGQTFDAGRCPFCGNAAKDPAGVGWQFDKSLNKYFFLFCAGIFASLVSKALFTPLDDRLIEAADLALIVVLSVICLGLLLCKQMLWILRFVKTMFAFVVIALLLSSAFVILNGAFDHYPLVHVETRVVRTYLAARSKTFYIVVSPSWRHGRNQEDFQPVGDFDADLQTGDLVRVEVHRGAFWLPWGPAVTDRMRCPSRIYGPSLC
jgi:hypothetical protein